MQKKKTTRTAASESLLVELLTEELPPKSLRVLGEALGEGVFNVLKEQQFLATESQPKIFATPRRLTVLIHHVQDKQPDRTVERRGPTVAAGYDKAGKPTSALTGFAQSCGVAIAKLEKVKDAKGEYFVYRSTRRGEQLKRRLAGIVEEAVRVLPVAKLMRWREGVAEFVRPVHGLVMLHGKHIIRGRVLGLESRGYAFGHRFLSKGKIKIPDADQYESVLEKQGSVIASFAKRREHIHAALGTAAKGAKPLWNDALLDEVTALVECPAVYQGSFSPEFLDVPQECLVLSMKQHQRYFPLADTKGRLLPKFLIVSNLKTRKPANIIQGNERVLRARLADAKFFFDHDRKTRLEERVPKLASVVYHNKLGSQLERVKRLQKLAGHIARKLGADASRVERAAYLCKADLLTDMVGEFPELQGVMGGYYAQHDGEAPAIADAIRHHYYPRFANDGLPVEKVATCVALADKLEVLAGLFGMGQQPTGDKDPFALRRHALGVIRILIEKKLDLDLRELTNLAFSIFDTVPTVGNVYTDLETFVYERLRGYLRDLGYSALEVESVLCYRPTRLDQLPPQLAAVRAFMKMPEASNLVAANKRVVNILKKSEENEEAFVNADPHYLSEPAERELYDVLVKISPEALKLLSQQDYTGYLKSFARLKKPIDAFFDTVMVMVEDEKIRSNRIALLTDLRKAMNQVADISKLAA